MIYNEAVKVKLDPTPSQIRTIQSHIGGARFAWNTMLEYIENNWGEICASSGYDIRNKWNELKHEIAPWYKENYKYCYEEACFDLAKSYKAFFDGCKGKRTDHPGHPKFKKKGCSRGSFRLARFKDYDDHGINLGKKFGRIHCFENIKKRIAGRKTTYITISYDGIDYYASIIAKTEYPEYNSHLSEFVGIDLGIKDLATLSDATVYENHKFLSKKEKRLKRYQRMMSRQKGSKKGEKKSNRYKKTQRKFRKLERKISNSRKDNLEKVTTEICKTYKNIVIEDLKVKNMQSKHQFAKSLSDVSFATFRGCLERKARKFNNKIFVIDTFYPSSKTCCNCGQVRAKLDLNERIYKCENCGLEIQRDLNAAINLEKVARRTQETQNAHGEFVKKISLKEISENSKKCESGNLNHLINIRPEVLGGNAKTLQDVL